MAAPNFRFAERRDLSLVYRFILDLAEYEKLTDCLVTTEQDLDKWLFQKEKAEVLFIMEDDTEVGFVMFFHNFPAYIHGAGLFIEALYIRPEYRGRGYGKAAFEKMARTALERGCVRIEWCCLDWNPALEFYRA
ncbi:MAG: GNAT family N-acetyltransferase, partial [Clostridia bacterium]|nr:GNAT family N-acetyltransferase [Clostridia bacterium]